MFMNEENGTRGAKAYFDAHAAEMDRHVLALESDRGGFTPRGFTSDANPDALEILAEIATLLRGAGAGDVSPGWGGVDIAPMAAGGVPLGSYMRARCCPSTRSTCVTVRAARSAGRSPIATVPS